MLSTLGNKWPRKANKKGDTLSAILFIVVRSIIYEKHIIERPNVGGVAIRSRNSASPRKG